MSIPIVLFATPKANILFGAVLRRAIVTLIPHQLELHEHSMHS